MDADDLGNGFRLGEWHVDPRERRVSGPQGVRALRDSHVDLLLVLARHHGEAVDTGTLARAAATGAGPTGDAGERSVAEQLRELAEILGDVVAHPRYIVPVGDDAFALIAHFEPVATPTPPDAPAARESRLHWLLGELRRRSVLKVAASYLVGMWIVLQVAQVTFAPLRFPDWWMTVLTILAILGLPIVVTLAWMYDITPAGIVVDPGAPGAVKLPRARQSLAPFIVVGVTLMASVTGFAWWRSIQVPAEPERMPFEPGPRSIAVLPLVDMSAGGGSSFLGDGLSEELSTRLAQVPGMRVAARTSAFEFKDRNIDVRRIGQSLGVRHVLEGSVRRDGNNVRVTVQLVDTRSGYHLWTSNFDRPWRDVLELQDDIARSVTEALEIVLTGHHVDLAPVPSSTFDSRAIDPYLAGLALLRKPSDASNLRQAEESFRQSLRFDPAFAGAHAGLCRALARAYDQSRDRAALTEAEAACRKALSLDASLIDTERALATLYVSSGDFQRATATYRALLERNPGDPDAHIGLGYALAGAGETAQAEASFRRAIAIEPSYWGAHSALASHLFKRGKNDEATLALRKATELAPTSASAWSNLGGALQMAGDVEGAAKAYQRSLELEPSKDAYSNLATLYFSAGRFGDAVRNFELALALGPHDQIIHGNLGDALWQVEGRREDAIATYHRAIELAEAELAATPGDPTLRAQLGFYYGRVGDRKRSISHLEQAVAAAPDLVYVQYYRAVAAADRDDRATALEAVRELVRLGYPQNVLRSAPEFRSLLRDPEYIKIVGSG